MKRRDFLRCTSAGLASVIAGTTGLIAWTPRAHAATINKTFYLTHGTSTMIDGTSVYFRGFSSSPGVVNVPGELITNDNGDVIQQGDTVNMTIHNTLNTTHRFTIDGLGVNETLRGGRTTRFSFVADKHGSFPYYDSSHAPSNRLLGLHGALPVLPRCSTDELYPNSPTFVQQYSWIFSEIDPVWHNAIRNGRTPSTP